MADNTIPDNISDELSLEYGEVFDWDDLWDDDLSLDEEDEEDEDDWSLDYIPHSDLSESEDEDSPEYFDWPNISSEEY
jgi:hypothetical protein